MTDFVTENTTQVKRDDESSADKNCTEKEYRAILVEGLVRHVKRGKRVYEKFSRFIR